MVEPTIEELKAENAALRERAEKAEQERALHIKWAKENQVHGVAVEVIKDEKSAIGWRVVVTDPEDDHQHEVEMALSAVAVLSATYVDMRAAVDARATVRGIVRMLIAEGLATPDRILLELDRLDAGEAPARMVRRNAVKARRQRHDDGNRGDEPAEPQHPYCVQCGAGHPEGGEHADPSVIARHEPPPLGEE